MGTAYYWIETITEFLTNKRFNRSVRYSFSSSVIGEFERSALRPGRLMMDNAAASTERNYDCMCKIVIVGNSGVGKTAFLQRFYDDTFRVRFITTVGVDYKVKMLYM